MGRCSECKKESPSPVVQEGSSVGPLVQQSRSDIVPGVYVSVPACLSCQEKANLHETWLRNMERDGFRDGRSRFANPFCRLPSSSLAGRLRASFRDSGFAFCGLCAIEKNRPLRGAVRAIGSKCAT